MRKKIIIASLALALLLAHTACDDNKDEYLSDFSTILYFRNSGELPMNLYRTGDDADYQLTVNKAGSQLGTSTEVTAVVMDAAALAVYNAEQLTHFRALPANCYELVGDTKLIFGSSDLSKQIDVVLKPDVIYTLPELPDGESYVLPMQLINSVDSINSKKNTVFLKPQIMVPTVYFSQSGYVQNFLTDEGPSEIQLSLSVTIPLPSKWNFDCAIESDEELLNAYNRENNCDYALLPTGQLSPGVSFTPNGNMMENFDITVKREGLIYGNYVLPLRLVSATKPQFVIDEERNTCLYGVSYVPLESKLRSVNLTPQMISYYPTTLNEGSVAEMLDGKEDTYFHSQYAPVVALPHYIQVELPKESTAFLFEYKTRHNNNNGAPQVIVVYGSADGVKFSRMTTIDSGLPAATKTSYKSPVFAGKPFKYLRISVEKTPSSSFAMAEFRLSVN